MLKRMRSHRPQLALLVVLLAGSLVLTGLLAFQGYLAERGHREEAQARLGEWAERVALDWDQRVQGTVRLSLYHTLLKPLVLDASHEVRDPAELAELVDAKTFCECMTPDDIRSVFIYDFDGHVLLTNTADLSESVRSWMTRALIDAPSVRIERIGAGGSVAAGSVVGAPDGAGRALFFVTLVRPDGERQITYGFETGSDALGRFFDATWQPPGLMPESVARKRPIDAFFSAHVADASGRGWYQSSAPDPSPYSAVHTMDQLLRDLEIAVTVRPDAADELLIGGLPASRRPVLFALLVLTAGLLGASIVLIRRESDIARLRADFIAGVSHELRTPLAQIRMFSETLMLGRVRGEDERKRSLAIIDQEARRLTHLVENVLLFARAERRSGRINPERIDLAAEVRDGVHGFAILCRSQAIEIRPELQEDVGVTVDRGALRQVLLNLLDNAVKYGPLAQRITVGMALFDGAARIWVDDEGNGVPEADRQRVFESFFRLDRDIDSAVAGSGIGLAIVRELITLHAGRVWIEDAPGGGARVVVELPGAYLRSDSAKDDWAVA